TPARRAPRSAGPPPLAPRRGKPRRSPPPRRRESPRRRAPRRGRAARRDSAPPARRRRSPARPAPLPVAGPPPPWCAPSAPRPDAAGTPRRQAARGDRHRHVVDAPPGAAHAALQRGPLGQRRRLHVAATLQRIRAAVLRWAAEALDVGYVEGDRQAGR